MTLFNWVIPIRLIDVIEIGIFAFILYKLYQLMRGTIAVQIFAGVFVLLGLQFIVTILDMTLLGSLFRVIGDVFVLAVIILFQPEIRRLLLVIGQNPLIRRFFTQKAAEPVVDEVMDAIMDLKQSRTGALIAIERTTGLRSYVETGALIQARISSELLQTIFYEKNPLHDGAVIIRSNRIEAARCILPVSTSMQLSPHLGLRHRSAIGLSETTDALVVVISEETGRVSIALNGEMTVDVAPDRLREYLTDAIANEAPAPARELAPTSA